jgi:hypothetical protein
MGGKWVENGWGNMGLSPFIDVYPFIPIFHIFINGWIVGMG